MKNDPKLGPAKRVASFEAALDAIREFYPNAYVEGSTGPERSFWVENEAVGIAWPIRVRNPELGYFVRLFLSPQPIKWP